MNEIGKAGIRARPPSPVDPDEVADSGKQELHSNADRAYFSWRFLPVQRKLS
jgi:hypothetical protein